MDYIEEVEEEAFLLAILQDEENERNNQRTKKRKIWVHEINLNRIQEGEFHKLYPHLKMDEDRLYTYFRMNFACFDELLELIKGGIQKMYSNYREPISPEERLALTLRFLDTGDSYKTIGHSYRIGFSTVGEIVKEVCVAIWQTLQPLYMPEPTKEIWKKSVDGYKNEWRFPNCLGSIDGKHVTIKCPKKSGSQYFSYLKKFSIVLMAIVDPYYSFICIHVGAYGKNSDGGIFAASNMGQKFEAGEFDLPHNITFPNQNQETPCVLIGDEAFSLSPYLMRPFPYRQARHDLRKEKFNYNLCKARSVVENAFGIMAHKWRFFFKPLEVQVETSTKIVKAACVLHNFLLRKNNHQHYDNLIESEERRDMRVFNNLPMHRRRDTAYSFEIRERFVEYFSVL